MTLGAIQVKGGSQPRRTGTCARAGTNPSGIIGGPYPVLIKEGGDFPGEDATGALFMRDELYKTIYVRYLDPHGNNSKRRYKLWIDYKHPYASDSKYFFKLNSDRKGSPPVETFWLSFQDVCEITFDSYSRAYIDNVEMFEYK